MPGNRDNKERYADLMDVKGNNENAQRAQFRNVNLLDNLCHKYKTSIRAIRRTKDIDEEDYCNWRGREENTGDGKEAKYYYKEGEISVEMMLNMGVVL